MPKESKAIAKVQLTIEVQLSQPWGEESTIAEINKRAQAEAIAKVHRVIGLAAEPMQIIGDINIICVITENK